MPDLSKLLVDTMSFRPTVLEESSKIPGAKYVARGEFARSDRPTENKRLYPHSLWERELGRLSKQLESRKVYGELDHPMDGRTQLKRASHIITDLHIEGNVVVGAAYIMDTDAGRNLKAIMDAGGAVGVSSRGFGTTKPNLKGEDVVQPDYKLMTFDFVAEPAMSSAYPEVTKEDRDETRPTEAAMGEEITFAELQENNPQLHESFMKDAEREYEERMAKLWAKKLMAAKEDATTELRAEFAEKLESTLGGAREEIETSIRERLMNDPSVGSAKKTLDEVKTLLRPLVVSEDVDAVVSEKESQIEALHEQLIEKDLQLASLAEENDKLATMAREAAYLYHLEQIIQGSDHADLVRSLVGEVAQYENVEALDERVEAIVEEVTKQQVHEDERDTEMQKLAEELELQKEATEKALQASQHLATLVYTEQRLANHPEAQEARVMIESRQPSTKAEVDQLLDSVRHRPSVTEDMDSVRARVRDLTNSGTREYIQEDAETKPQNGQNGAVQDWNGLGAPIEEIRALSGYEDDPNSN